MSEKFQNKYRIPSARLQNWDYGWNAAYFVTICTQNREYYFGDIVNGEMMLSEIGKIVKQNITEIRNHFPYIELGEFIVMPNHLHGIIVINKTGDGRGNDVGRDGRDAINRVSTTPTIPTTPITPSPSSSPPPSIELSPIPPIPTKQQGGITGLKNPMLTDNLSKIIRWYKGRVTHESRKIHADFAWQSRFHDHIIRDIKSFQKITKYIRNNPLNWQNDKFRNET